MAELEGRDVGSTEDFVVCVHGAAHAVGAGVFDLKERGWGVSLGLGRAEEGDIEGDEEGERERMSRKENDKGDDRRER
jgi:hypothetical protein